MTSRIVGRVEFVPIVHGRLAFALEVRRRILDDPPAAIAVELPPFLTVPVDDAIGELPKPTVILYRPERYAPEGDPPYYAVPIQPADGIVEALRIAVPERIPVAFIDVEVEAPNPHGVIVPDPLAVRGLGLDAWVDAVDPLVQSVPRVESDDVREKHMAFELVQMSEELDRRASLGEVDPFARILCVVGLAHWRRIRDLFEANSGKPATGVDVEEMTVVRAPISEHSLPHAMGEMPYIVARYEMHRSGFEIDDFDPAASLKSLVSHAKRRIEKRDSGSLESPDVARVRVMLDYLRKLTVRNGMLMPDPYRLAVAAKGCVGDEFALEVLACATSYPLRGGPGIDDPWPTESDLDDIIDDAVDRLCLHGGAGPDDSSSQGQPAGDEDVYSPSRSDEEVELDGSAVLVDGDVAPMRVRQPGTPFTTGRLALERRPDRYERKKFDERWDERVQCSWPPEDVVIEDFRAHIAKRALSLARISARRTEPFTTSFLDGLDLRETLRDVVERRLHVFEEPRSPGEVGALVLIFEEDDYGERYPWRTTWHAEHDGESTLAFYATDFRENLIGPGIARAHYGGCLLIYPPIGIPDIWNDLRFERARTPSERLLLAATYWAKDRFIVHVSKKPPRPEVREEAGRRGKHLVHLPLSTFSPTALERIRRVHVLNGQQVRSYANRFIR